MPLAPAIATRPVRLIHFCPWAAELAPAPAFVASLPGRDLRASVADPTNAEMLSMARLDCDWHGENARAFSHLTHPDLELLETLVVGATGLAGLAALPPAPGEERWLVLMAQHPQQIAPVIGRLLPFLRRQGLRVLYYAYDEASRTMPCFRDLAPHIDVLIHDEFPLDPAGAARLRPDCRVIHRSWVANVVPNSTPFFEAPEERLLFLGSKMGFTPHRRRQVEFLQARLGDRLVAVHDHSWPVGERDRLAARFKASLCPEGRKFDTPAMAASHTDRPFWSGCLGLVPVSEDSQAGGRLEELHRAGLIRRYPHGDLDALLAACEQALAAPVAERRRIYDYFNAHETVGTVVADAIVAASPH